MSSDGSGMFAPLSEAQFQKARKALEEIRKLIALRERLIDAGKLDPELVLPSVMWKPITLFRYTLDPSYDIVNTCRLHTYPFTGNYLGYAIDNGYNKKPPTRIAWRHRQLTDGLPS